MNWQEILKTYTRMKEKLLIDMKERLQ